MKKVMDEMFNFWGVECGENKELLNFLIQDESDLSLFMDKHYTGSIVLDMRSFQQHKRFINTMSEDEFLGKFEENKKEALEDLLQEPMCESMLGYMLKYSVTEKEIYARYKKFPKRTFLNLVRGEQTKVKPSYDLLLKL